MKIQSYYTLRKSTITFLTVALLSLFFFNIDRYGKINRKYQNRAHRCTGKWYKVYNSKEITASLQYDVNCEIT